jgi:hypothetical protein
MTTLLLGWTNHIKAASSLTASSAAAGLGPDQLATDQGATSTALQTAASVVTVTVTVDMGAAVTWRLLGLFRTNLTPDATVRWRLGDDPTFATNTVDTGTISADVAAGYGQHVYPLDADVSARYLRCTLGDTGNPQGFLNIPLMFAGPAWQPPIQWSPDAVESAVVDGASPTTRGGQVWPELRWRRRRRSVPLPLVPRADRWPQLGALEVHAATGGNVLLVPSPGGDLSREPVFGPAEFDGVGYASRAAHLYRTTRFAVTERL